MIKVRSRQAYLKAGANVTIITLLFVLARLALHDSSDIMHLSIGIVTAVIGGIVTTFVISGIAPAIERIGGYGGFIWSSTSAYEIEWWGVGHGKIGF